MSYWCIASTNLCTTKRTAQTSVFHSISQLITLHIQPPLPATTKTTKQTEEQQLATKQAVPRRKDLILIFCISTLLV
jgi:hypothetical protein